MEQTGIASLGVDWKILIAQLVNFLMVYFLLNRFAFRPLVKLLEERRSKVARSIKTAEEIERAKEALDKKVSATMSHARNEAQEIIARAESAIKTERQKSRQELEAQTAVMLADTKTQIESYKVGAKKELAREIGMLIIKTTERTIDQELASETKNKVADRAISEIKR